MIYYHYETESSIDDCIDYNSIPLDKKSSQKQS